MNIEQLRVRAIARAAEAREARQELRFQRAAGAGWEYVANLERELARAEGAAAGSLFALREAEYDRAAGMAMAA